MSQITIYLDQNTEMMMRKFVKKMGSSLSQWLTGLIKKELVSLWPESVKKLAGACPNFPSVQEIRNTFGADVKREEL